MLKIMIVEDEPIIRNGIANSLDWESMDCEVIALAENGNDAIRQIEICAPDIVISDIMMPEMDGLELSDRILNTYSGVKIILLTGYKEFDFVKQAIKMGVSNYLLKPTDPDELESAVRELAKEIRNKIQITDETEKLRDIVRNSKDQLKDKFLYELMFRPFIKIADVESKAKYYDINTKSYRLLGISLDSFSELETYFTEEDINILMFLTKNIFDDLIAKTQIAATTIIRDRCIYAIVECMNYSKEELEEFLKELCIHVKTQGKFTVSVGVSDIYENIDKLRWARKEVDECLEQRVFVGDSKVIFNNAINHCNSTSDEKITIKDFINAIQNGEDILNEARIIQSKIVESRDENMSRNTALEAIVLGVTTYCSSCGKIEDLFDSFIIPLESITHAKTLNDISDSFYAIAVLIDNVMTKRISSRYFQAMEIAKKIINDNYNKDINLDSIASQVFMSKWYFSKIFKRIIGENFISYLTNIRMSKAKELLTNNPEFKNYEVSEKVGFISVRYFSELFKKNVGVTPSEYRSKSR